MFHPCFDSLSFQFKFISLSVTPFFLSLVFQLLCFFVVSNLALIISAFFASISALAVSALALSASVFCFCFILESNFLKFECAQSFLFYLFLFFLPFLYLLFFFVLPLSFLSNLIHSSVKNCFNSSLEYPKEVPTSIKALFFADMFMLRYNTLRFGEISSVIYLLLSKI